MNNVVITEKCSCGASITVTGGRFRADADSRNPRSAEEITERWRSDHKHSHEGGDHTYTVPDGPKMMRETLCRAESLVLHREWDKQFIERDAGIIARLIDECDRKRPLGPDGKHDDRHTPECGCDDDG